MVVGTRGRASGGRAPAASWRRGNVCVVCAPLVKPDATCARRRILTAKCVGRLRNVVAGHAWASWWDLIALKREKAAKVAVAAAHWNKLAQGKAWRAMRDDFLWRQEVKRMAKRWMNPLRAKALAGACAFLRPPPLA